MKKIPPFVRFLLRFFGTYIILSIIYGFFLNQVDSSNNQVDNITVFVSKLVEKSSPIIDIDLELINSTQEPAILTIINKDKIVAKIIEGCNGISVIILFISFIIAFYSGTLKTLSFVLLGSLLIFFLNIIRIDLLIYGLYYHPEYKDLLHDIIFPISIYGIVLILWIIWIFKLNPKK